MADAADRVLAAYDDVAAVEHTAPGMVRVVTFSDVYTVDVRHEACECSDFEYNLNGAGRCKHLWAALDATDQLPAAVDGHWLEDDLDERPGLPDFEDFDDPRGCYA